MDINFIAIENIYNKHDNRVNRLYLPHLYLVIPLLNHQQLEYQHQQHQPEEPEALT
jgi:hypothetical protein